MSGPAIDSAALVDVLVPLFAFGLALVHLYAGRLRFLDVVPRSRWLSLAGGVSVAYVFVHILPEVGAAADAIDESGTVLAAVDRHVYLVTLAGFVVFYGLERFARERAGAGGDRNSSLDDSRSGGGSTRAVRSPSGPLAERPGAGIVTGRGILAPHRVVRRHDGRSDRRRGRRPRGRSRRVSPVGGPMACGTVETGFDRANAASASRARAGTSGESGRSVPETALLNL